jgi:hypothetical protein
MTAASMPASRKVIAAVWQGVHGDVLAGQAGAGGRGPGQVEAESPLDGVGGKRLAAWVREEGVAGTGGPLFEVGLEDRRGGCRQRSGAFLAAARSASSCAEPRCLIFRDPRREDHTTCTAAPPGDVRFCVVDAVDLA